MDTTVEGVVKTLIRSLVDVAKEEMRDEYHESQEIIKFQAKKIEALKKVVEHYEKECGNLFEYVDGDDLKPNFKGA